MELSLDEAGLTHLLGAKSPQEVDKLFTTVFRFRHEGCTAKQKSEWAASFELSAAQVEQLVAAVRGLVGYCIYEQVADKESVAQLFSAGFHANLKGLICKIVGARIAGWREASVATMVSPPKLVDFDWRVDQKRASNFLSRMSVPTVIVDMKIQKQPTSLEVMPGVDEIQFELSKEALRTMLDGLGKIRDQLGSIK